MIATAAVQNLLGGDEAMAQSRTPEIFADAAYAILSRDPRECTGNSFIDDEVLAEEGVPTCPVPGRRAASWRWTCSSTAGRSEDPLRLHGQHLPLADGGGRVPRVSPRTG